MNSGQSGKRYHIGINAHLLSGIPGYRRAGIHHYISNLLVHMSGFNNTIKMTVFTSEEAQLFLPSSLPTECSRWPTSRRFVRIMWEQLAWPILAKKKNLNLMHSMAFVTPLIPGCDTIVTVYDLSFVHFPDRFPLLQRSYLRTQTRRSCRQAKHIVAISEASRQDIHKLYGVTLENISVVHPGVDEMFKPLPDSEVEDFKVSRDISQPYFLHVGTLQPRKNIPLLIDAFAELDRTDVDLILVGGKGWSYNEIFDRVKTHGLENRIRFTGYVSDLELVKWYNGAVALVLPSEYEGFGMPAAQAMACGTPVIASNSSALPEVTGDAACIFEPGDKTALCEHMANVLDDPRNRATMRANGIEQARKFTWQLAADKTLKIYQDSLGIA